MSHGCASVTRARDPRFASTVLMSQPRSGAGSGGWPAPLRWFAGGVAAATPPVVAGLAVPLVVHGRGLAAAGLWAWTAIAIAMAVAMLAMLAMLAMGVWAAGRRPASGRSRRSMLR